ncbi:MAG: S9 family peptidase [Pseudomonadota bacterium]
MSKDPDLSRAGQPPLAEQRPVTDDRFGDLRVDSFGWLRAENWQEVMRDPTCLQDDIRSYLEAENAFFLQQMSDTETLQERLFEEMRGRIKEDDSTVPSPDGPWAYSIRFVEGQQHPLFVRSPRDGGTEQVLLDGNALAEGKPYFKLAGASQSPDHQLLAWAFDDKGSEKFTLRLRDLESGDDLPDTILETASGGVWSADGRYVFYVRLDDNHRPSKVFRHQLGTDPELDVLVYEERDPGFFTSVSKTRSGKLILINSHDHETAEIHTIPADQPERAPECIASREVGLEYDVDEANGVLYIRTNADGAMDFKIVSAPLADPGRDNWRDYVPAQDGVYLLSVSAFADYLVRLERIDGLPQIVVHRLSDQSEHAISFDEEAYSLGVDPGFEFDTTSLRFSYSSMSTPRRTYDYDMETRARVLRKEDEVPSGHDPDDYVTRRIMAPAPDGELVPVSLLYRRTTKLDGTAPCLLYGYGAYGIAIPASFSTARLSLVDRGFVYALAHVRGGKDKGTRWYEDGKKHHKKNTFSDFIAVADHLVAENFTGEKKIVAEGGSAGGMLMGAITNMAPQKFAGILAIVPFVDVLNTMLDDTLPLTPPEWPEWGNPGANGDDYTYIRSYSPYDNVTEQVYPPILAVGGLTDPRVTYWEPAKWVAKLRQTLQDSRHILLRTNMEAGHAGAAGRFDALKETAIEYAFALKVTECQSREPENS